MSGGVSAAVGEDLALGLAMAGVKDILVHTQGSDRSHLASWFSLRTADREGVVVLSAEAASKLRKELFERRSSGTMLPVVVVIPGRDEDVIAQELMRRAIGMVPTERQAEVRS